MKEVLDAIEKALQEIKALRDQCDEHMKNARGDQINKLDRMRTSLECKIHRLAICKDVLGGKAFVIEDSEAGELTVVKPSPATAALLDLAEKNGGRLIKEDG